MKLSSEIVDKQNKDIDDIRIIEKKKDNNDSSEITNSSLTTNDNVSDIKETKEEIVITKSNDSPNNNVETPKVEKTNSNTSSPKIEESTNSTSNNTDNSNDNSNENINNSSNNEEKPIVPVEVPQEDNSVRTNDIFYRIHKGRIDYTDLDTCQNETLSFYLKYIRNINNLNYIEVMSNSDNILGYFVEYVFKEASYDNYEECDNIGNSIKSSLSDRVTGYQCNQKDNSYYLKIFTDYD